VKRTHEKVIDEECLQNGKIIGSKSVTCLLDGDEKVEETKMRCLVGMDHELTGEEGWTDALKATRKVVETINDTGGSERTERTLEKGTRVCDG
jgi:hypothetical protein